MTEFVAADDLLHGDWKDKMCALALRHQGRYDFDIPKDDQLRHREKVWAQWHPLFRDHFRAQLHHLRCGGNDWWRGAGFCERCGDYDTLRWENLEMCRNDECAGEGGLCPYCRGEDPDGECGEWHGAICQSCCANDARDYEAELWR